MMIKCQKCGFENQMGSIFCRECGEKLNMDAIDPNKLQKDVDKEKNIKLAKKRIKSAISGAISILVVVAFIFLVFPDLFPFGKMRQYEEPTGITEAAVKQKYTSATSGTTAGKVKYSYPEINQMLKTEVVEPLSELDSFAKVTAMEVGYDEEKGQTVAYIWISIKEKVPVLYTVHGDFVFNPNDPDTNELQPEPITVDVKRLDIGRLPVFVSTHTFLNGFKSLTENEAMQNFFRRAQNVEFTADGMSVEFAKGAPGAAQTPAPSSNKPSSASAAAALKGGSTALSEKDEAAREAARQKAEEEKEKKRQQAEERKRKQEEEAERKRQKEEERKQKIEEEKERKRQQEEERKRRIEEENERRRQEAEDRRREREERRNNDRYNNNSRSSRSSRSSRNRY